MANIWEEDKGVKTVWHSRGEEGTHGRKHLKRLFEMVSLSLAISLHTSQCCRRHLPVHWYWTNQASWPLDRGDRSKNTRKIKENGAICRHYKCPVTLNHRLTVHGSGVPQGLRNMVPTATRLKVMKLLLKAVVSLLFLWHYITQSYLISTSFTHCAPM